MDSKYEFLFAYYDYRLIPKELLTYLIKEYNEAYRKGYAIMFKWKGDKINDALWKFIADIEIQDDYKYIRIGDDTMDEEVGCLEEFDARISKVIFHKNDTDIQKHDELLINLNIEHAKFDTWVTERMSR